jgi:4-oxalocrotonate tautomerase
MPIITVDMLAGRTDDQKRALAKELTDAIVRTAAASPQTVQVIIRDVPADHWSVAGKLIADRSPA